MPITPQAFYAKQKLIKEAYLDEQAKWYTENKSRLFDEIDICLLQGFTKISVSEFAPIDKIREAYSNWSLKIYPSTEKINSRMHSYSKNVLIVEFIKGYDL